MTELPSTRSGLVLFARASGGIGVLGALVGWALLLSGHEGGISDPNRLDVLSALSVFLMIVNWVLGIRHWSKGYVRQARGRRRWGVIVILGFAFGSTLYWFMKPWEQGDRSAAE